MSVDDSLGGTDGGPGDPVLGSPMADLVMRLSNSPDLTDAPWQPFKPVVDDWDLGLLAPGEVATVYVQFSDANDNVGDGQPASIVYEPSAVTPTATPTPAPTTRPPATDTPTPTGWPAGAGTPIPTATPTAPPPGLPGDLNCDDTVNSIDAGLILQFDAGLLGSLPP